jgi:hypothetical protein
VNSLEVIVLFQRVKQRTDKPEVGVRQMTYLSPKSNFFPQGMIEPFLKMTNGKNGRTKQHPQI